MTGWILKTDGTVEKVDKNLHVQNGSLKALYAAIGCSIVERVQAPWGEFWVDEEGLASGKLNDLATQIYWETFPHVCWPLVGDVFLRVKASGKQAKHLAKHLVKVLEIRAQSPTAWERIELGAL